MSLTIPTQMSEGRVLSGADAVIVQGRTNQLGFATDMAVNGNWNLQGIRVLGKLEYIDIKAMGFDGNATVGTFLLKNPESDVIGELQDQGWQPDGTHLINEAGFFSFQINDIINQVTLLTLIGMKIGGFNYTIPQTGLVTKSTDWQYMKAIPGAFSA